MAIAEHNHSAHACMPRFLVPHKSTQHRVAAIALYRALLSKCRSANLSEDDCTALRHVVANKFRRSRALQSTRQLEGLFRAGYETLDHLTTSATGSDESTSMLKVLVSSLSPRLKQASPVASSVELPPTSTGKHPLDVLPPDRAVLNVRPYAKTTGPRHVPILASANGIPFLRLTKPQPPALSRVIRQKLHRRNERFHRSVLLSNYWIPIARQEDEWDDILYREVGIRDETGRGGEVKKVRDRGKHGAKGGMTKPGGWVSVMLEAHEENWQAYEKDIATDKEIAKKMLAIVDEETRLAKLEGQTVVRGRKGKPIKERWLK